MNIDAYKEVLETLASLYKDEDRNEATTRMQIIDTLFFECLGWEKRDCITEDHYNKEYTDYEFLLSGRKALIVEAKKEGVYFELPASLSNREYQLKTIAAKGSNVSNAINQVTKYCHDRGVQLAAICNGHQLCVFLAVRADGIPLMSGKSVVFYSLEDMLENFVLLWDLLSYEGVRSHQARQRLTNLATKSIPPKFSSRIPDYTASRKRNNFQNTLQILSDLVLDAPHNSPEFEREFLEFCYCSSGALSQYTRLTKKILSSRYANITDNIDSPPTIKPVTDKKGQIDPDLFSYGLGKKPILLLGDVGVGKTSFIRNLIRVKAKDHFKKSISLYIDLGSQANLTQNILKYILNDIKDQLDKDYGIKIYSRAIIQSVYNREIEDFKGGLDGYLLEDDIAEYRRKEAEYLKALTSDLSSHLEKCFSHVYRGQKKQIIVFLDNADQRSDVIQQRSFLIAEEFAKRWDCIVFVALRPETYHRSQQSGALSGYHSRAFSILPPRIDLVIKKRIDYALTQLSGKAPLSKYDSSIHGTFPGMISVLKSLKLSLRYNKDLIESIDNISAGNVRIALDYIRMFLGSGHVNTKKIANIFDESGSYIIPSHEFIRSIIFGDQKYYVPSRSPVVNVFDLHHDKPSWHFLIPVIMTVVSNHIVEEDANGFISVDDILEITQQKGFESYSTFQIIHMLSNKNLLDSGVKNLKTPPKKVRLTTLGSYHLYTLPSMFTYMDAIIVDTPIRGSSWRARFDDATSIRDRLERVKVFISYLDEQWEESDLQENDFQWNELKEQCLGDIDKILGRVKESHFVET